MQYSRTKTTEDECSSHLASREGACSTWPVDPFASVHQCGSLLHPDLTVLQQLVQVGFVVLWAVVCGAIQGVSDLHLLDLLHLLRRGCKDRIMSFLTANNAGLVSSASSKVT